MFTGKQLQRNDAALLFNFIRLPGRISTGEAAALLGFAEPDMARLISVKLLKPLGRPAANAPKYFASETILACCRDPEWLSRATEAIAKFWKGKNAQKPNQSCQGCGTNVVVRK